MREQEKILLWNMSTKLRGDIEKLNPDYYKIVGRSGEDEDILLEDGIEYISPAMIKETDFNYILIPHAGFKENRKILQEEYGVQVEKIYTFEEFWVKNSETDIENKYHKLWDDMQQAGISLFKDKTVIITGGGTGIGRETARVFLQMGANVIIIGRKKGRLESACNELRQYGQIRYLEWDITQIQMGKRKLEICESMFNSKPEILINCAGILGEVTNFYDVSEEYFDRIIGTNLKATYFMCQLFAKYYLKNHIKGRMVNVISTVGNQPTVTPYGVSKWGMSGLTKGLGANLAEYGIIVNGVAPGTTATSMTGWKKGETPARRHTPIGRLAFPCEIANIIINLAGLPGENMPGEIIESDGGYRFTSMNF